MTRAELEHAIRAACDVANETAVWIFGSQAILAQHPDAPAGLLRSIEADIAPVRRADAADLIDGALGEGSPFHRTFGYYVHGVTIDAAILPDGWERRVVEIRNENTRGHAGRCLEVHDLAASKLVAFREKDREFVRLLLLEDLVNARRLRLRIEQLPLARCDLSRRTTMLAWLAGTLSELGRAS